MDFCSLSFQVSQKIPDMWICFYLLCWGSYCMCLHTDSEAPCSRLPPVVCPRCNVLNPQLCCKGCPRAPRQGPSSLLLAQCSFGLRAGWHGAPRSRFAQVRDTGMFVVLGEAGCVLPCVGGLLCPLHLCSGTGLLLTPMGCVWPGKVQQKGCLLLLVLVNRKLALNFPGKKST